MEIKIACQCGQRFAAKERLAGKTVKCPKCGSSLVIPEPKPAAKPAPAELILGCLILGLVLSSVGQALCLTVPKATGAKGLIIAAVVMQLASVGIKLFVKSEAGSVSETQIANLVGSLLSLAAAVTFVAFLKRLGEYLNRSDLAQKAQTLIVGGRCLVVMTIIMIPVLLFTVTAHPTPAAVSPSMNTFGSVMLFVAFGMGIFSLYLAASYVGLLLGLSSEIAKRRGR